jgi:hypothetical protein
MGGSGDPLADCQDFNALLATTIEALETLLPSLRAQEEGLTRAEPELREHLRGAQAAASALDQEVAPSGGAAVTALHDLATFATQACESAAALETDAGEAEEAAGHDLDQVGERLHAGIDELVSVPFASLDHDLADECSELAQAATDTQEGLTTLEGAFSVAGTGIGRDLESSGEALDGAEKEVDVLGDKLIDLSPDGVSAAGYVLEHVVPDTLHESVALRIQEVKDAWQAWEERLEAEATLLQSSGDTLVEAGAASLEAVVQSSREALAAVQHEWSLAQLEAEQTAADLEEAVPALEAAVGLASRIGETQQRIEWIQQVIDAMDTK